MKKGFIILLLMVLIGVFNITFSQEIPNDGDLRIITETGSISKISDGCDPYGSYAFYEGSDVYFLLFSEGLKNFEYAILKNSDARKYGQIFTGNLQLPFISNIQPKNGTVNTPTNKVIVAKATGGMFYVPSNYNTPRNQIAGQLVTNNEYRLLRSTNPMRSYFFTNFNEEKVTIQASSNFSPNPVPKKACVSYYFAYCGDGIVDTNNLNEGVDGQGGIMTQEDGFKKWHDTSIKPNESCDDGEDNGKPGKCKIDCSGYDDGEVGEMIVTKKLTIEQNYNPQETLQFRINFSNPGKDKLENIQIEDFLPQGFKYISSEIYGVQGAALSTGQEQSDFLITYKGFSLNPGANGYILIDAELMSCNFTLNNVFWEAISNGQTITGHTTKLVNCNSDPVKISKTANPSTVAGGQMMGFTIAVNNSTDEAISNVRVEDEWPSCISFVSGSVETNIPSTQTTIGNTTQRSIQSSLNPGQSFVINFSGQTSDSPNCVGTHVNTGKVLLIDDQGGQETNTNVTITEAIYNVSIKKEVIQAGFGPGDYVIYSITYKNNGNQTIQSFRIKDYRPSSLEFISAEPNPSSNINPLQSPIVWNIYTPLLPGGTGEIRINAKIKTDLK